MVLAVKNKDFLELFAAFHYDLFVPLL